MKSYLKSTLLLLALACATPLYSLDLQTKIPKNALYVLTINGQNILSKMPAEEIDKLEMMRKIYKQLPVNEGGLKATGINFNSTTYAFVEICDSMTYFVTLIPLSDPGKFEAVASRDKEVTKDTRGNKMVSESDYVLAWNNEFAVLIVGKASESYFTAKPELYANYGFEEAVETPDNYTDTYPEEPAYTDTIAADTSQGDYMDYNYNTYDNWTAKYNMRKKIEKIWMGQKAAQLFVLDPAQSISTDVRFTQNQDKTAEATLWGGTSQEFFNTVWKSMYGTRMGDPSMFAYTGMFGANNYMFASFKCNTQDVTINLTSRMDPKISGYYSKMTNAKLNKKFLKYIPDDNLLGYYSVALNTRAILEETPRLMEPYFEMIPYTKGIGKDIMDLYALMLDEEAIGKLVKGDAVFAVTNLVQKQVEYTSYEYDSLYNYSTVLKTRTETIPEFVVMYSTDDKENTDKIFNIFAKKGIFKKHDEYYESPELPGSSFQIFMLQKDGIVFICNTKQQVMLILKGKADKPLSKEHAGNMTSGAASAFVDVKKILELWAEPDSKRDKKQYNFSRKNFRSIYVTQDKIKGNEVKSQMKLTLPEGSQNGVVYFFNLLNGFYKIDQSKTEEGSDE